MRTGVGVLVGLMMLTAAPLAAATGVAFVHGTGTENDALNNYWTSKFVNAVRDGLPDPDLYVVANCDFEQYVFKEAAAGCLADTLNDFITANAIDDLVVVTHSHGGNVMRWILSNPSFDERYPPIIDVVRSVEALAPSSAGTPLADAVIDGNIFEEAVGWLLGYVNDGVRMQQEAWMAHINDTWLYGTDGRPELPVQFLSMVGTDVETAIWDGDSYCGGYFLNLGLEVTQWWLNSCSDGFLDCSSQRAAGYYVYDHEFTKDREPLCHNQSRRKCFKLDQYLRDRL